MKKQLIVLFLCFILSAALAVGTTMAYLTATDSKVNVMTVGSVAIAQYEMERVTKTNSGEDSLQPFTQYQELLPAVGEIKWVEKASALTRATERVYQEWPTGGSSALFDVCLNNVIDKFVFVENQGKSDAYVRTWFAFEAGTWTAEQLNNQMIHWNRNTTHWTWTDFSEDMQITLGGVKYYLRVATYTGSDTVHPGGALPSGETARPSLLQFFFDSSLTNEDVAIFGNDYKILVYSQACQSAGFSNAHDSLVAGFGEATAENNPWKDVTVDPVPDTTSTNSDSATE